MKKGGSGQRVDNGLVAGLAAIYQGIRSVLTALVVGLNSWRNFDKEMELSGSVGFGYDYGRTGCLCIFFHVNFSALT